MKQTTLTFILFFASFPLLYSQMNVKNDSIKQDTVKVKIKKNTVPKIRTYFLNENGMGITEKSFNRKCAAAVFYCNRIDRKNMKIFKVYHRMYFGKLSPKEYNQLRIYLNKKSNKKIPANHKILIHYEETLVGFKESNEHCNLINDRSLKENYEAYNKRAVKNGEYPFESIKYFQRYIRNHRLQFHDENKFNADVASYAKQQNNCIKKMELKYQTPVFYVVNKNYNYPIKNEHFTWVIDGGDIKTTFLKNHPDTDFILIKPNGEYFIKNDIMPDFALSKLLKAKNWDQFRQDWATSIKTNSPYGLGIVQSITKEYEFYTSNCY